MEITVKGDMEELEEFCRRFIGKPQSVEIKTEVPKATVTKQPKQTKKTPKRTYNTDGEFLFFTATMRKEYELKWAMSKYNEDWSVLRYKNGHGYRVFEVNLPMLYFLNSFRNGKITYKEVKQYSEKYGVSESRIGKIIYNLQQGIFDDYFKVVNHEVKKINIQILKNDCLIINSVITDLKKYDAESLIFGIQNAPNKGRYVLNNWKQYGNCLELKEYVVLCANYTNPKVVEILKNGGL